MRLADFYYDLPPELIAHYPLTERSASRLLCLSAEGKLHDGCFTDLVKFITDKDLIVFNQSKVIPARLRGHKETGGQVEVLVERCLTDQTLLVHLRASKAPAIGSTLFFSAGHRFKVMGRNNNLFILQIESTMPLLEMLEQIGEIPLPPYMQRRAEESDKIRYQTIYAQEKGSVAAPTAGLHFDEIMMAKLRAKGVDLAFLTLHVGAGTFLPVRTNNIVDHHMHSEYVEVSAEVCEKVKKTKMRGGRVVAVGTTSVRGLETAAQTGEMQPYYGNTNLFIYPGYQFNCIDLLLTNFHLPESTLLMLVCAFGGYEKVMAAYRQAMQYGYRFYSYGDAMLVTKNKQK